MRLQHVHISDYKNLKNFTLSFDNDSFLDVFVGKNGTGKSNLFWIKDDSLTVLENYPESKIPADEIIENIEAGLGSFRAVAGTLTQ